MGVRLMIRFRKYLVIAALGVGALGISTWRADAGPYVQTNLVSDIAGLAKITEPELVNPWGISHTATSPFWTSNQGTNTANLFAVTGQTNVSKVTPANTNGNITIPTFGGGPAQGPTGQVSNTNTSSFPVASGGDGAFAHFIFANLNGTISAWDTGQTAFIQVMPTAGVATTYTGLAINTAQTRLYAANDAGTTGSINVFNSTFAPVSLGAGAFANPFPGLVPLNVQDIGGKVYVTYALPGLAAMRGATEGNGGVAVFNEDGVLLQTLISGSKLASPWGVALAPAGFGEFANDLLVGNFSFVASEINAFDPTTGVLKGTIPIDPGNGNTPGGLWSLIFGVGGTNGGDPNTLYITDGIGTDGMSGETHGLFAAIAPVPEPSSLALLAAAFGLFAARRARARR
jgi:uncharacterized protein (TIGR03118 family)